MNSFYYVCKNWTVFLKTPRIELFLKNYDSQNWTLLLNMIHRMEPFFSIWIKELNLFSKYHSKNWTCLFNRTFSIWLKRFKFSTHPFFLKKWVKYLNPFWTWLKELNFFHLVHIIELYFSIDSQNWFFFKSYFKSWVFFFKKKKLKELKELNPSWISLKNWTFFVENMTQRTKLFFCSIWLKELFLPFFMTLIFEFFFHMTQTIEFFFFTSLKYLNFWNFFDSKKWTFFSKTQSFFTN